MQKIKHTILESSRLHIILLLGITLVILFFSGNVFAKNTEVTTKPQKYNDPFIEMRAKIEDFSAFIHQKEKDVSCYHDRGKDLVMYYKMHNTPLLAKRASTEVEVGSRTYNRNINEMDDAIHKLVVEFFRKISTHGSVPVFVVFSKCFYELFALNIFYCRVKIFRRYKPFM